MLWVYLSPHLDDAVLSCGGLIWQQTQSGERVEIWTLCAGDPPNAPLSPFAESLHARWQTDLNAPDHRRAEDLTSCALVGALARHWPLPDCIYRRDAQGRYLYASEEAIFGPVHPAEEGLIEDLAAQLRREIPAQAQVIAPLTIGLHADHRLARAAAQRLQRSLWYYPDYPYVLSRPEHLGLLLSADWSSQVFPLSAAAITRWAQATAAHVSQISTFWPDQDAIHPALLGYATLVGGVRLWRE